MAYLFILSPLRSDSSNHRAMGAYALHATRGSRRASFSPRDEEEIVGSASRRRRPSWPATLHLLRVVRVGVGDLFSAVTVRIGDAPAGVSSASAATRGENHEEEEKHPADAADEAYIPGLVRRT
jgi:hypothetical protein